MDFDFDSKISFVIFVKSLVNKGSWTFNDRTIGELHTKFMLLIISVFSTIVVKNGLKW